LTLHEDLGATARRIGLIGLPVLLGLFGALLYSGVSPQRAIAEKCITCEIEEPGEEVEAQILTIEITGQGSVSNGTKPIAKTPASPRKAAKWNWPKAKK
jgi:hypothetical protein